MKILITGTSGGIGSAVASLARADGHEVVEFNREDFAGLGAHAGQIDMSNLDAVVFATGFCPVMSVARTTDFMFDDAIGVNCGLFLKLMRHIVANKLNASGGMRAVAISSISAREGWAGGAAYCASKAALSAMCRAMDAELAQRGIRVIALEPGHVNTRMFRNNAGKMGVDPSLAKPVRDFAREVLDALNSTDEKNK